MLIDDIRAIIEAQKAKIQPKSTGSMIGSYIPTFLVPAYFAPKPLSDIEQQQKELADEVDKLKLMVQRYDEESIKKQFLVLYRAHIEQNQGKPKTDCDLLYLAIAQKIYPDMITELTIDAIDVFMSSPERVSSAAKDELLPSKTAPLTLGYKPTFGTVNLAGIRINSGLLPTSNGLGLPWTQRPTLPANTLAIVPAGRLSLVRSLTPGFLPPMCIDLGVQGGVLPTTSFMSDLSAIPFSPRRRLQALLGSESAITPSTFNTGHSSIPLDVSSAPFVPNRPSPWPFVIKPRFTPEQLRKLLANVPISAAPKSITAQDGLRSDVSKTGEHVNKSEAPSPILAALKSMGLIKYETMQVSSVEMAVFYLNFIPATDYPQFLSKATIKIRLGNDLKRILPELDEARYQALGKALVETRQRFRMLLNNIFDAFAIPGRELSIDMMLGCLPQEERYAAIIIKDRQQKSLLQTIITRKMWTILSMLSSEDCLRIIREKDGTDSSILGELLLTPDHWQAVLSRIPNDARWEAIKEVTSSNGLSILSKAIGNLDLTKVILTLLPEGKRLDAIKEKDSFGRNMIGEAIGKLEDFKEILSLLPQGERPQAINEKDNHGSSMLDVTTVTLPLLLDILGLLPVGSRFLVLQAKDKFDQRLLSKLPHADLAAFFEQLVALLEKDECKRLKKDQALLALVPDSIKVAFDIRLQEKIGVDEPKAADSKADLEALPINYAFYLKCLTSLAVVAAVIALVVGIMIHMPVLAIVGGSVAATGSVGLLAYRFFSRKPIVEDDVEFDDQVSLGKA